jgi:hypothetical protein
MKNIVIAAVVAVATTSVYAEDHFGQVPLRAEVRASTSIVVTPTALAANLDIDGDAASGPIATVVVKSNDDYEVTLTSDNFEAGDIAGLTDTQFFLRQAGTSSTGTGLGERINYQLTFDGQGVTPAARGVVIAAGQATGNVGRTATLNIVIEGNQNYSAGVYGDLLTLTVSPDTSFAIGGNVLP